MAASPSSGQKQPSVPSISSTTHSQSIRSYRTLAPSTIKTVITAPPWAKDEPPSPNPDEVEHESEQASARPRPSDVTSRQSSVGPPGSPSGSRWWAFTLPRHRDCPPTPLSASGEPPEAGPSRMKRGISLKERSMSWIPSNHRRCSQDGNVSTRREKDPETSHTLDVKPWGLQISLPPPPEAPFTLAHNMTPGWDSPWTARAGQGWSGRPDYSELENGHGREVLQHDEDNERNLGRWGNRKKCLRAFILTNVYVPLLFRFINITFTTSALAVAIRIRLIEMQYHVLGAVGSSPTLVIIFAPLTLLHVMFAIYLEYFGRPLGLWRTSRKLAHTLLEVLFICAWSAALSLSFDNYFTSLVPCAPATDLSWYNQIQRPQSPIAYVLGRGSGGVGDRICDDQLVLICLVLVGLIMYCTNLIISLFRIFEKVKYRPPR